MNCSKRIFSLLLVLVLFPVLGISAASVQSNGSDSAVKVDENYPDFQYTVIYDDNSVFPKDSAYIYSYTGKGGNVTIPSTLDGHPVSTIGYRAFLGCDNITSLTIPDSVTNIVSRAFYECKGIISVSFPDSVTSIGWEAFYGCEKLEEISIPDSVIAIGGDAFAKTAWYALKPNGLVYAGKVAYAMKGRSPSHVEIEEGTLSIADWAFNGRIYLESVVIPDSVIYIGDWAFQDTSLKSVTIPASVTSIGDRAFGYKTELDDYDVNVFPLKVLDFTIIGYKDSDAQRYADENKIPFLPLEKPTEKQIILGDTDSDGVVSIIDATNIQKKLASLSTLLFNETAADADGDGTVSIIDATFVQKYLASLPCPEGIGKPIES